VESSEESNLDTSTSSSPDLANLVEDYFFSSVTLEMIGKLVSFELGSPLPQAHFQAKMNYDGSLEALLAVLVTICMS
jgi:hypothetical protein